MLRHAIQCFLAAHSECEGKAEFLFTSDEKGKKDARPGQARGAGKGAQAKKKMSLLTLLLRYMHSS